MTREEEFDDAATDVSSQMNVQYAFIADTSWFDSLPAWHQQRLIDEYISGKRHINICHCFNLVKNCKSPIFLGYIQANKHIDDNGNIILTFKIDDIVYDALWSITYGYAVCHDDDKYYFLVPNQNDDGYYLMSCDYEPDI